MAEFMRALRTLKALQAEQAREQAAGARVVELAPTRPRAPARVAPHPAVQHMPLDVQAPKEPERRPLNEYAIPDQPGSGRTLYEPDAPWMPNEPEARTPRSSASATDLREIAPRLVDGPLRATRGEHHVPAASCQAQPSAADRTNPRTE